MIDSAKDLISSLLRDPKLMQDLRENPADFVRRFRLGDTHHHIVNEARRLLTNFFSSGPECGGGALNRNQGKTETGLVAAVSLVGVVGMLAVVASVSVVAINRSSD
jgi:hypothetical protein